MTLKQAIRDKKMRQADVAAQLGVSEPTLSRWANGHQAVPTSFLRPLSDLLEVPVEALLPPRGSVAA